MLKKKGQYLNWHGEKIGFNIQVIICKSWNQTKMNNKCVNKALIVMYVVNTQSEKKKPFSEK